MKKLLTAMTLVFGMTNVATATDFDLNPNLIAITAVRAVVHEVLGGSSSLKIGTGGVVIETTNVIETGKVTRCWNAPVYDSEGNVTFTLQCY